MNFRKIIELKCEVYYFFTMKKLSTVSLLFSPIFRSLPLIFSLKQNTFNKKKFFYFMKTYSFAIVNVNVN